MSAPLRRRTGTLRLSDDTAAPSCLGTDPKTDLAVMAGEIAGSHAPRDKQIGRAGATIKGSSETPQARKDARQSTGVRVGRDLSRVAEIARGVRGAGRG